MAGICLTIFFGCSQSKQTQQTTKSDADSVESEVGDVFYESPIEVLEKPKLKLPDSLSIDDVKGYTVIHIYMDTLNNISKEVGSFVLIDSTGKRVVEYIRNEGYPDKKHKAEAVKGDIAAYLAWVNLRLDELKVKRKENVKYNMNVFTRVLLRIEE